MTSGLRTIVYPVSDLAPARALFARLFGTPHTDESWYVGFRLADQEIGLDPNGHASGMNSPVGYWHVDDIEEGLAQLLAAGACALQPIREVGGGRRIASVTDPDGNIIGLLQDP